MKQEFDYSGKSIVKFFKKISEHKDFDAIGGICVGVILAVSAIAIVYYFIMAV